MDLRVLVLTADPGLSELVRAQVENLGCSCSLVDTYDGIGPMADWADAAIVDLAGDGLESLHRLRVELPALRVLAISPDPALEGEARSAGADRVLLEPFSIADMVEAVRALGPSGRDDTVVDLRPGTTVPDDAPWWVTR